MYRSFFPVVGVLLFLSTLPQGIDKHTGTYERLIADDWNGSVEIQTLLTDAGERIKLNGKRLGHNTGDRIEVHGRRRGEQIDMDDAMLLVAATVEALTAHRVLVILVSTPDHPAPPYAPGLAADAMTTRVAPFYAENSYGQISVATDVTNWLAVSTSLADCNYNALANAADQAATGAGYNPSNYQHTMYAFAQTPACTWWGLGAVGGKRSWINGSFELYVAGHELGHNLGVGHSTRDDCAGGGCVSVEYGDTFDIMGGGSFGGHWNVSQKTTVGWLPPPQTVGAGVYTLAPLETNGGLKAIAVNGTTIEVRTSTGFDAPISPQVTLHRPSPLTGKIALVDLDPVTTQFVGGLTQGQSTSIGNASITVQVLSNQGAQILVATGAPPPGNPSPDGTRSPPAAEIVDAAGSTWTLAANGTTLRNGLPFGGGVGSVLTWCGGKVRTLGTDRQWYVVNGSGWSAIGIADLCTSTPPPPPPGNPSPDGTRSPPAAEIVDAAGSTWTLAANGTTLRNGLPFGGGVGSVLTWCGGKVRTLGTDRQWYVVNGSGWSAIGIADPCTSTPPPPPPGNPSPDGTRSPPAAEIVDAAGSTWTLAANGTTLRNGLPFGGGVGSVLTWCGGKVRTLGTDRQWYVVNGSGWSAIGIADPCTSTPPLPVNDQDAWTSAPRAS